MNTRTTELIQKYLDQVLSETELVELEELLQGDSQAAKAFANATRMNASLAATFQEEGATRDVTETFRAFEKKVGPSQLRKTFLQRRWTVVVAAIVLIALVPLFLWSNVEDTHRVLDGQIVTEEGKTDLLRNGESFTVTEDGPALIQLADGSQAELQPATRAVLHGATGKARQVVELLAGSGTFRVTKGDEQFKVTSSIGQVTVLGTEFSVDLLDKKEMKVTVTSGRVRVNVGDQSVTLGPKESQVFEAQCGFKPDPSKTYYIDCPAVGGRLAAKGAEAQGNMGTHKETFNIPEVVPQSETGPNVEWKFVPIGNRWHIENAAGGENLRLRFVNLPELHGVAMTDITIRGGWAQFTFADADDGKYFITAPDGPPRFKWLRFVNDRTAGATMHRSKEANSQFVITEVK